MTDDKISDNEAIDAALQLDGNPENIKAYYEDWAKTYNLDISQAQYTGPAIAAKLLNQHMHETAVRLLDAGCGTGLVGIELDALGYRQIDGFDLSESMVEQAAASGSYQQLRGGIDMMRADESYRPQTYDAVLSIGVFTLGHVPPEALSVLLQLVVPGGLLVISTRSHYYEQTDFQQFVDALIETRQLSLLQLLEDAPYNHDGYAHYWVFRKSD